jgi:hypothetical protein
MEAALACLARLDAGRDSNAAEVAKVAADVEQLLGAHAGAYEQLVRDGLNMSLARMDAMQKAIVKKVDQQGGLIVAEIAELRKEIFGMALAQKDEKKDLEKVQSGVQGSKDSFEDLFELAPCTVEAYVQMHGEDAADTGDEERSELGEGAFGTTYRMRARTEAKLVGVKPGQLFAVKKVASVDQLNLDLLFKRAVSDSVKNSSSGFRTYRNI